MSNIYDAYQLANSRNTRPYQGSTIPELTKVADVYQGRYDATQMGQEGLQGMMRSIVYRPEDEALVSNRLGEYKTNLDKLTNRPDLENVTMDVYKLGRRFAEESNAFASSYAREKEYQKHLDELVQKGPGQGGVSRQTASMLAQRSKDNSALQYDPQSGRYAGGFSGNTIASEVDTNEWIKKVASDVAASKGASIVEKPDGLYFHKQGYSDEKVDYDKQIKPAIQRAYELDPEIQSDFAQRASLNGYQLRGVKAKDIKDPNIRKTVEDLIQRGASESQAIQMVAEQSTYKDLKNTLENYGRKYAYRKSESEDSFNGFTTEGQRDANKVIDEAPLIISGPDMRFNEKDRDIDNLKKGIDADSNTIKDIQSRIQNSHLYDSDEIAKYRQQLLIAQSNKMAKETIISGAEDEVARKMGYLNREDLIAKNKTEATIYTKTNIPKVGSSIMSVGGDKLTVYAVGEIPKICSGCYQVIYKDKNGTTQQLRNIKPGEFIDSNSKPAKIMKDFDEQVKTEVKDNAEKYAFKPSELVLTKDESQQLKKALLANPSAANWFKPGDSEPTTSGIPDDFEVGSIKVMKNNGSVYFSANELSTDKGKQGTPTGKNFVLQLGPGNNAAPMIASRLLKMDSKGNVNANKDALAAASVLLNGNWSGMLNSLQQNEKIPVTTSAGRVIGYVQRKGFINDPNDSRFKVFNQYGVDISDKMPLTTRQDVGTLAGYIEKETALQEQSDSKKK